MTDPGAVRQLLDAALREPRVYSLEAAVARVAELPLADVTAELLDVLATPITGEAGWRLAVLVSTLHHRNSAGLDLTESLFAAIEKARTREEVTTHVLLEP